MLRDPLTATAFGADRRAVSLPLLLTLLFWASVGGADDGCPSKAPVLPPDARVSESPEVVPATSTPEEAKLETSSDTTLSELGPSADAGYSIQRDKIYFGDSTTFSSPAVLSASKVYEKIPSYRKVLDKGITKHDPEYWPLIRQASRVFVRGMKSICRKNGYDLVGEIGSITPRDGAEEVIDITKDVIEVAVMDRIVRGAAEAEAGGELDAGLDAGEEDELDELVNFPVLPR